MKISVGALVAGIVLEATPAQATLFEGFAWYDPRGMAGIDGNTNNAAYGDWTGSFADLENVKNVLPYLRICVMERDGNCQDHAPGCTENDDDYADDAGNCNGTTSSGYFSATGTPPEGLGDSTWEIYLWTRFASTGYEVRIERNIEGHETIDVVSPEWNVSTSAGTTTRNWNVTCPERLASSSSNVDCSDYGGNPASYFTSAERYTGWYALFFRDMSALQRVLPDYNPPNKNVTNHMDCTRARFQQHVRVVLYEDSDTSLGAKVRGSCPEETCNSWTTDDADLIVVTGPSAERDHVVTNGSPQDVFDPDCSGLPGGDGNCPCCDMDAAPESHMPFEGAHELGHVLQLRWSCVQASDPRSPAWCSGGVSNGWATPGSERCSTGEGWADFVHLAAAWPQDHGGAGGVLFPLYGGYFVLQAEFISPGGSDTNWLPSNRDCYCDAETNWLQEDECNSTAVVAFWDAYDTRNENGPGTQSDGGHDGSDGSDVATFERMLQGANEDGMWWKYCDTPSGNGTDNNCEREDSDQNPDTVNGAFQRAMNLYDYDANSTDNFASEIEQACGRQQQNEP